MNKSFQSLGSFCALIICSVLLVVSGCENPGQVGSGLAGPEAEVVTDTIFIDGLEAIQANSYSGELSFFSAGSYNDPLFGDMEATAFLKPALPAEGDSMESDAKMLLRISVDGNQVYGDMAAGQEFSIYEIDEFWRDRALKIDDEVQINTNQEVGKFTVENNDSLDVELSTDWVDEYRQFAEDSDSDSLYQFNFFGLALVPDNENKIISLNSSSTRFVIQNPEADTFEVATLEWGYNLSRSGSNALSQGSVPFYSTYESVINFDEFGVSDLEIPASGFSRAELVVYQNESEMEQSMQSEPTTAKRPAESTVYLHFADSSEIPGSIDPGAPDRIAGTYSADEGAYRFDVTPVVDRIIQAGLPEEREFFITFPNDGVIKPALIYTDSEGVPVEKRPKIVITSLKKQK